MIAKLILLGTLTITAYRPVRWQTKPTCTDRHHCETATGENVSELGVAVSRDLLQSGVVHFGDVLFITGIGYRIVFDVMGPRNYKALDVFVYEKNEERKIGTRHLKVWLIGEQENVSKEDQ
jgi:3D (Asp-Asp-Asp) domain-containing protein